MSKKTNVGKPAVTKIDFKTWCEEFNTDVKKINKRKNKKEVVHPIFEEFSNCTNDPFWKEKFVNASYNKFPRNFFFSEGKLSYKKGSKILHQEINEDIVNSAENCMEFFRLYGRLFSTIDQNNSMKNHISSEEKEELVWDKIGKKTQFMIISYFVCDERDKNNLSKEEYKILSRTIEMGILNRHIDKNNINLQKNRIISITGLTWDEETRQYNLEERAKSSSSRNNKKKEDNGNFDDKDCEARYHNKWKKYTKNLLDVCEKTGDVKENTFDKSDFSDFDYSESATSEYYNE